jgi:hypothetical protein
MIVRGSAATTSWIAQGGESNEGVLELALTDQLLSAAQVKQQSSMTSTNLSTQSMATAAAGTSVSSSSSSGRGGSCKQVTVSIVDDGQDKSYYIQCPPLSTNYRLLIIHYPLSTIHHPLSTIYYQ